MEEDKTIELHELITYIDKKCINKNIINNTPNIKSDNDYFTDLIKSERIDDAISMICNNKDLKFNNCDVNI